MIRKINYYDNKYNNNNNNNLGFCFNSSGAKCLFIISILMIGIFFCLNICILLCKILSIYTYRKLISSSSSSSTTSSNKFFYL